MRYNINNIVSLEIREDSKFFPYFDKELHVFASKRKCEKNIIIQEKEKFNIVGCNILERFENYAFNRNSIYIRLRNGYVRLPRDISENTIVIEYERSVKEDYMLFAIFKYFLRKSLIEKGFSLTHASCVARNDKAHVFIAWMHTGKTNIMLQMLKNGYKYLSDDKIILSKDGYAYPYPKKINLFSYNLDTHPWLKKYLMEAKLLKRTQFKYKIWLLNRLQNIINHNIFSSIVINFLIRQAYSSVNSSLQFKIDPSLINAEVEMNKRRIASAFILIREKGRKKLKIEDIDNLNMECKRIVAINDSEDLFKIRHQHACSFVFPDQYEANIKDETEILENALKNVKMFKAYVPEEGATKETCEEIAHFINENI